MEEAKTPKTGKKRGPKPGTAKAKHGGQALMRMYGRKHLAEIGRRGGEEVAKRFGGDYYQRIGKKGGDATKANQGEDYYHKLGALGAATREANKAKRKARLERDAAKAVEQLREETRSA